jgi:hypothetical protein
MFQPENVADNSFKVNLFEVLEKKENIHNLQK